jgi:hypothetical protein
MNMTEEKAKEVLDFLARKIGYDGIQLYEHNDFWTTVFWPKIFGNKPFYIRCIAYRDCTNDIATTAFLYHKLGVPIITPNRYDEALRHLIELSSAGEEITYDNRVKVFLPAYSSLEEILIEMDLDNGLK